MRYASTPGRLAPRSVKVPDTTAYFWLAKGLSTAMGEATSDYLVHALGPVPAVLLGFVAFVAALALQLRTRRYVALAYWSAVVGVGVFGTMAADVLHVGLGVPYAVSTALFACVLAAVFLTWRRTERTLSIHDVDTVRRELLYWAAVVATFALGTAAGDLTATTLGLGYLDSVVLFAAVILVPALGYRFARWNGVFSFWFAYVVTRPLGASVADALGKPKDVSGLGFGEGAACLVLTAAVAAVVAFLARSGADDPAGRRGATIEAGAELA